MDRQKLEHILKPHMQTIILCKNDIKLVKPDKETEKALTNPTPLDATKQRSIGDAYAGDVCPALFDPKFPNFVKTTDGYYFEERRKFERNQWATFYPNDQNKNNNKKKHSPPKPENNPSTNDEKESKQKPPNEFQDFLFDTNITIPTQITSSMTDNIIFPGPVQSNETAKTTRGPFQDFLFGTNKFMDVDVKIQANNVSQPKEKEKENINHKKPPKKKAKKILPQILFIKPPLETHATYDYFHELTTKYKLLQETLFDSANINCILSKELISVILLFLPFSFPIFISCASVYRGAGYTHFVYPYTKSKELVLEYLNKCEEYFDSFPDDCYYESCYYVMKDELRSKLKIPRGGMEEYKTTVPFLYNKDTMHRIYNKAILVAQKEYCHKLKDVIQDRNNVGGSYWLRMEWERNDKNVQSLPNYDKNEQKVDKDEFEKLNKWTDLHSRIGGSQGKKSRCYYQTDYIGEYLPMSVVNIVCSAKLFKS